MNEPRQPYSRAPETLTPEPPNDITGTFERRNAGRRRCDAEWRAMEADVRTFVAHVDDKVKHAAARGSDTRLFSPLTVKFVEDQRARLVRLDSDCYR